MPEPAEQEVKIDEEALLLAIYTGGVSIFNLPENLYLSTAKVFRKGLYQGYGGSLASFDINTPDYKLLKALRTNVYAFSGAKTATQVQQMRGAMVEGDKIIPFKEFKKKAGVIFETYNKNYLQAEYVTSIGMARNAETWKDIQQHKELFPYIRYIAVMDKHTCPICSHLHLITLPVDHPFWNKNMPENHFRCMCVVEKIDKYETVKITPENEVNEKVKESERTKSPLFNFNPGKDETIFNKAHPYFDIGREYPALAKKNFNLKIPAHD